MGSPGPFRSHLATRLVVSLASIAAAAAAFAPAPRADVGRTPLAAAVTPLPVVEPSPPPAPVIRPLRIDLPTLRVSAPVIPVGIDADGAMGTPSTASQVAWWDGVMVGAGNALLAGHKDWRRQPGSFYNIAQLRPGDPITISGDGGQLTFKVQWVQQMPGDADATRILGDQGAPVVTLITCGGEFDTRIRHYKDRIVVRGVLA